MHTWSGHVECFMIWFCKSLLSQIQWITYSLCTGPSCSWWVPRNSTRIEDRSLLLLHRAKHSFIKIYYKVLQAYIMKLKAFISWVDSLLSKIWLCTPLLLLLLLLFMVLCQKKGMFLRLVVQVASRNTSFTIR